MAGPVPRSQAPHPPGLLSAASLHRRQAAAPSGGAARPLLCCWPGLVALLSGAWAGRHPVQPQNGHLAASHASYTCQSRSVQESAGSHCTQHPLHGGMSSGRLEPGMKLLTSPDSAILRRETMQSCAASARRSACCRSRGSDSCLLAAEPAGTSSCAAASASSAQVMMQVQYAMLQPQNRCRQGPAHDLYLTIVVAAGGAQGQHARCTATNTQALSRGRLQHIHSPPILVRADQHQSREQARQQRRRSGL